MGILSFILLLLSLSIAGYSTYRLYGLLEKCPVPNQYLQGALGLLIIWCLFIIGLLISSYLTPLTGLQGLLVGLTALFSSAIFFLILYAAPYAEKQCRMLLTLLNGHLHLITEAEKDPLTRAITQTDFDQLLKEVIALTHYSQQYALLYIDIKGLSKINAEFGYDNGDAILKTIVHCFSKTLRKDDIIARVNDDEFCILAKLGIGDPEPHVDALISRVGGLYPEFSRQTTVPIHLAVGVILIAKNTQDNQDALLDKAKTACEKAKKKPNIKGIQFVIADS